MNKLVLGTVQFGLNYGVTNQYGQVKTDEIRKILGIAKEKGIDTLDTAASYGNCEQVLGKIGINDFNVITKTVMLKDNLNHVIDSFQKSLDSLGKDHIKGLLVHNINDIRDNQFDALFERLNSLKKEGVVEKIGFSSYTPDEVDFLLGNFDFDLIQLPFNVFDTRLIDGGQLKSLKKRRIEVHARSIFLQGILLDFDNLSDYFLAWKVRFQNYQILVRDSELSLLEYSLNYVLSIKEIDKVLVGVNNAVQLTEIVEAIKDYGNLNSYSIRDEDLLNPARWKI